MHEVTTALWHGAVGVSEVLFRTPVPVLGAWMTVGMVVLVVLMRRHPARIWRCAALVPDAHGGNMDRPEMRTGVTCYLGVNAEGALLSLGDGHARRARARPAGWRSSAR